jgi:hypothetical protein
VSEVPARERLISICANGAVVYRNLLATLGLNIGALTKRRAIFTEEEKKRTKKPGAI